MSSDHAPTGGTLGIDTPADRITGRVAADLPAEDRLHDKSVTLERGSTGVLASLDGEEFSVVVFAEDSVDTGELHEAVAAAYLQAALDIGLRRGDSR